MPREMTYSQAIQEALDIVLSKYHDTILLGLGVPDRSGCFGTTLGLAQKHGPDRVFDIPCSENAITGACIGMAINGLRPILCHQRMDFTLLSYEQLVNQAAKWHFLFQQPVPMVVRMVVGRGWGQGPTHAQSFHSFLASIPGLKVICPVTPHDAKGMLLQAIEDPNPVIMVEHRWLHPLKGDVPEGYYTVEIGTDRMVKEGSDGTLAGISYGVIEAMKAAQEAQKIGIHLAVTDLRSLSPLGLANTASSLNVTKRLDVYDIAPGFCGIGAEVIAHFAEVGMEFKFRNVQCRTRRGPPHCPSPSSKPLAARYYGNDQDKPDTAFGPF